MYYRTKKRVTLRNEFDQEVTIEKGMILKETVKPPMYAFVVGRAFLVRGNVAIIEDSQVSKCRKSPEEYPEQFRGEL